MYKHKGIINIKMIVLVVILAMGLVTTVGCSRSVDAADVASNEEVIKIGVFEPLSGEDKKAAEAEILGIELAHKLYPHVKGKKVELVYMDNKSDLLHGKLAALKLINEGVDIVLGSYGNIMSMVGGEHFEKAELPAITITCTNPLVTKGNPYYFRVIATDYFQATMAAYYVQNEIGPEKIVIMKQADDDYGTALAQQFIEDLSAQPEEDEETVSIFNEEFKEGEESFELHLKQIKRLGANVVYLPCSPEVGATVISQARGLGIEALFIGTDIWHDEVFIEEGGQAVQGAIFTDYFDGDSTIGEKTDEFLKAYKLEHDDDTPLKEAALGYDAYLLAIHAIREQMKSNLPLREVLSRIKDFTGATGSIAFDEDGDPIKSVVLMTVEKGKFVHKYTAEPEYETKKGEI